MHSDTVTNFAFIIRTFSARKQLKTPDLLNALCVWVAFRCLWHTGIWHRSIFYFKRGHSATFGEDGRGHWGHSRSRLWGAAVAAGSSSPSLPSWRERHFPMHPTDPLGSSVIDARGPKPTAVPLHEPTFFSPVSQAVGEGGARPVTQRRCRQDGCSCSETRIRSQASRQDKAEERVRERCYRGEGRGPGSCGAPARTFPRLKRPTKTTQEPAAAQGLTAVHGKNQGGFVNPSDRLS